MPRTRTPLSYQVVRATTINPQTGVREHGHVVLSSRSSDAVFEVWNDKYSALKALAACEALNAEAATFEAERAQLAAQRQEAIAALESAEQALNVFRDSSEVFGDE